MKRLTDEQMRIMTHEERLAHFEASANFRLGVAVGFAVLVGALVGFWRGPDYLGLDPLVGVGAGILAVAVVIGLLHSLRLFWEWLQGRDAPYREGPLWDLLDSLGEWIGLALYWGVIAIGAIGILLLAAALAQGQ